MPSTVIARSSYDAQSGRLTVQFVSGRRYLYFDVPPDVAAQLDAAASKGGYFNRAVRDRYRFLELEPAA